MKTTLTELTRGMAPSTGRLDMLALLVFATIHQLLSTPLHAATLTVSNINDSGSGSLRQAIQSAASGDTINLSVTGAITLTSGELLVSKNLSVFGPGAFSLAISGNTNSRVFEISPNATVNISGLTIRDGHAPDGVVAGAAGANGGGIYNAGNLTLNSCAVISSTAGNGFSYKVQPITLNAYVVGGAGGHGGGIYNLGTLKLASCTLSGNTGGRGGRSWNSFSGNNIGGAGGHGGGLFNAGTSTLTNCTLSGNTGGVGGVGGGHLSISGPGNALPGGAGGVGGGAYNAGALTLTACTASGNGAGAGGTGGSGGRGGTGGAGGSGGAIYNATNTSAATLRNSLTALNQPGAGGAAGMGAALSGATGFAGIGPDLFGPFTSRGHNLVGQADGSTGLTNSSMGDLVGSAAAPLDPLLGPLQNNGGPTYTMALLAGSPALDAGDDAMLNAPFNLATDQRGYARKSGAHVDIGAFESQVPGTPPYMGSPTLLGNGTFGFAFTSTPGASFTVLATTNLSLPSSDWTELGGAIETSPGQFQFTDGEATNNLQRYYQLRSP